MASAKRSQTGRRALGAQRRNRGSGPETCYATGFVKVVTKVLGLTWRQLREAKGFDLARVPSEVRQEAERELNSEAAGD